MLQSEKAAQVEVKLESLDNTVKKEVSRPESPVADQASNTLRAVEPKASPGKPAASPNTKQQEQYLRESKKPYMSAREEKLLSAGAPAEVAKPAHTSPAGKEPPAQLPSEPLPVVDESPSKVLERKRRDLNRPFKSKVDKKMLRVQKLLSSGMQPSINSSGISSKAPSQSQDTAAKQRQNTLSSN